VSRRLTRELLCAIIAFVAWGRVVGVALVNAGVVVGASIFGRCDGRDRSIMTARRRCRSVLRGDRGIV
jgi:hypothetical protein